MPRVIFFTTKQDLYFRLLIVDISNYNILYFFTNFLFLTWIVRIKYSKEEYYTNVVPKKKRRINGKIRNLIKKMGRFNFLKTGRITLNNFSRN